MKSHPAERHPADSNLRQPAAHMISASKTTPKSKPGRHSRRSTAEAQPSGRQPDDHVARGSLLVRVRRVGKGRAAVGPPAPEQAEANHGHDPANRDDDANRHAEVRPEVQVLVFAEREAKLHQGPEDRRRRLGAAARVSFFSLLLFPFPRPQRGALDKQGRRLTGGPRMPISMTPDLEVATPPTTRIAMHSITDKTRSIRSMLRKPQNPTMGEDGSANAFGLAAIASEAVENLASWGNGGGGS